MVKAGVIYNVGTGLIQVYTETAKEKNAALGLAIRAVGHGFKVFIIQFMKDKAIM